MQGFTLSSWVSQRVTIMGCMVDVHSIPLREWVPASTQQSPHFTSTFGWMGLSSLGVQSWL